MFLSRIRFLLLVLGASAFAVSPALADQTAKNASGTSFTFRTSVQSTVHTTANTCVTVADNTIDCFTTLNAIAHPEDQASANAHSGVPFQCVRKATAANTTDTDGDYEFAQCSAGRLWVEIGGANSVFGSQADAAWASGSGSAIALLKTIATASLDTTALTVSAHKTSAPVRIVSAAATTNLTEIADSGGCVIGSLTGSTVRTSKIFAKFYNAADGAVTVGTTTPYMTIPLPAGGTNPTVFQLDVNQRFASGACSVAFTTAAADNSTAALTAGDLEGILITWNP